MVTGETREIRGKCQTEDIVGGSPPKENSGVANDRQAKTARNTKQHPDQIQGFNQNGR